MKKHTTHEVGGLRLLCLMAALLLLASALVACKTKPAPEEGSTEVIGSTEEPTGETQEPTTPPVETTAETEPETQPEPQPLVLGLANVALGRSALANAGDVQGANVYLTDGDKKTVYQSHNTTEAVTEDYPYQIVVDLVIPYTIKRLVVIKSNRPACFYEKFEVEVSNDGENYTRVGTQAEAVMGSKGFEMELSETARFVRITSTDLGEREDYRLSIGEIEIYGEITQANNIQPSKRELAMRPGATELLTLTSHVGKPGKLTFTSSDEGVVSVDAETGLITALADGWAVVHVTDEVSHVSVPVTVQTATREYSISTFYRSEHGLSNRETFALLKEAGITVVETLRPYDGFGNLSTEYIRLLAQEYGLRVNIADKVHTSLFLGKNDKEIRAIVAKYKNLPAYDGMYIVDEPSNANDYARIYLSMLEEDPYGNHHVNLLPQVMSDHHGYVSDWVASVGGDKLRYLTYDNYPFGPVEGTFYTSVYKSMDEIRRTGLLYGVDTGYYLQGMGILDGYRIPTDAEMLYHASLGVAYGMKDFKWFVWFTPPYYGSGEHFTTGILNPDMGKSDIYEGVKAANIMIRTLSPILSNADAVELYHTNPDGTLLPEDFCVMPDKGNHFILSVMVDRESGQQYLCVVNKNMREAVRLSMAIRDDGLRELWNVTTGEVVPLTIEGGKVSVELPAGGLCVLKLPEGYDARFDTAVEPTESLLVGHGAVVSSSLGGDGHYAYMLTDGDRTKTSWVSRTSKTPTAWVFYDLKKPTDFNRLDIYPAGEGDTLGQRFPKALSVWVSDDGVNYTKLAERTDIRPETWGSIIFEQVTARYIKVSLDSLCEVNGGFCAELGELELYLDEGQISPMRIAEK